VPFPQNKTQLIRVGQVRVPWKNSYGKSLLAGVIIGLLLLAGLNYWKQSRTQRAETAALLYENMLSELQQGKAEALRAISAKEQVPLARCAFVGDSSNDLWIARAAGFTIAFNPSSPELEEEAGVVVWSDDLRDILPHLIRDTK